MDLYAEMRLDPFLDAVTTFQKNKLTHIKRYVENENGDVQVKIQINPNSFRMPLGQYTAKLVIGYQDGETMKTLVSSTDFWVIPWKLILAILVGSGFGVFLFYQQKNKKSKSKSKK